MEEECRKLQRQLEEARSHVTRVGMLLGVPCPEPRDDETVADAWRRWMDAIEASIEQEKQLLPVRLAAALDLSASPFRPSAAGLSGHDLNA